MLPLRAHGCRPGLSVWILLFIWCHTTMVKHHELSYPSDSGGYKCRNSILLLLFPVYTVSVITTPSLAPNDIQVQDDVTTMGGCNNPTSIKQIISNITAAPRKNSCKNPISISRVLFLFCGTVFSIILQYLFHCFLGIVRQTVWRMQQL